MIIYHHRRIAILLNGDFPKEFPMGIRHGRSLAPLTKRGIKYGKLRRAKTLQSLKLMQLHQNMHQCQHVKNKWTKPRNLIPLNYCFVDFLFIPRSWIITIPNILASIYNPGSNHQPTGVLIRQVCWLECTPKKCTVFRPSSFVTCLKTT